MIIKISEIIEITIPKKFSEKQIGEFMTKFWKEYNRLTQIDKFHFDFTQAEWIANQNLLLLSGLIKYLYYLGKKFYIKLLPNDHRTLNKRKVEQICEIWYVWKLHSIFDTRQDIEEHIEQFGNNDTLKKLCEKYDIYFEKYERNKSFDLFEDRLSVIPFVSLNYIENARYENTNAQLKPVYALNNVINQELNNCNCAHPFTKKIISAIITRELYDNFLDHFNNEKSFFKSSQNWAFMSISLKQELSLKKIEYNIKECKTEEDIFRYLESKNIYISELKKNLSKQDITLVSDTKKYLSFIIDYIKENISNSNFNTQEIKEAKVSDLKEKTDEGEQLIKLYYDGNEFDETKVKDSKNNNVEIIIENFESEIESIDIDTKLVSKLKERLKDIENKINEPYSADERIEVQLKPMACSTMVINKKDYFNKNIRPKDRDTKAVEMESYGVARAAQIANGGKTKWLIFKSVMDKTQLKDDDYKAKAAYTSAQFLKHLLEMDII